MLARFLLGGRREDGLGKFGALLEAWGEGDAAGATAGEAARVSAASALGGTVSPAAISIPASPVIRPMVPKSFNPQANLADHWIKASGAGHSAKISIARLHNRGKVTPRWPIYLPARSA